MTLHTVAHFRRLLSLAADSCSNTVRHTGVMFLSSSSGSNMESYKNGEN